MELQNNSNDEYSFQELEDDLVSIIMPAYNCEKYISQAIESVLCQTYSNIEIIVIDDGSVDNTLSIINIYALQDNRIRSIPNERNIGVSKTRNRGIDYSFGKWIAFIDSDDVWVPNKIEVQLATAQRTSAKIIASGCVFIDENGDTNNKQYSPPRCITYRSLQRWNSIICSSVLIRKEAMKDNRFENDNLREDYLLWLRMLKPSGYAIGVDKPLVKYRILKNSRSSNKMKMIKQTYYVHKAMCSSRLSSLFFVTSHYFMSYWRKYKNI